MVVRRAHEQGIPCFSWDLTVFDSPHQKWSVLCKQTDVIWFSVFVLFPKTSLKHNYLKTHHRLVTATFYCPQWSVIEGTAFPSLDTKEKLSSSDQLLPAPQLTKLWSRHDVHFRKRTCFFFFLRRAILPSGAARDDACGFSFCSGAIFHISVILRRMWRPWGNLRVKWRKADGVSGSAVGGNVRHG